MVKIIKRKRRILKSPVSSFKRLAIIALLILGVYVLGKEAYTIFKLSGIKKAEDKEVKMIQAEHDSLKDEISRLTVDSLYIEEIARREYGMIKPGEKAYRITFQDSNIIQENLDKNKDKN